MENGTTIETMEFADGSGYSYRLLSGHKGSVNALDFFAGDDKCFASGSDDGTCRLWDLRTRKPYKCMHQCFDGQAVDSVAFHPPNGENQHLFYAAAGWSLHVFDLRKEGVLDKSPLQSMQVTGEGCDVEAIAVDYSDGQCLVAGDTNGRLHRLDLGDEGMGRHTLLDTKHSSVVSSLSFLSKKRGLLASGCLSGQLSQTNVYQDTACGKSIGFCDRPLHSMDGEEEGEEGGKDFSQMVNPPLVYAVASACDGECILSANGDGAIYLFDADSMDCEDMAEQAHGSIINALHVIGHGQGRSFLSGGTDKIIQAWDIRPDEETDSQWDLCSRWKLLHPEKINAISGPRLSSTSAGASPFVIADVSKDLRVYDVQ